VSDELLTWADGALIDAELHSDYVESEADRVAAQTQEETYAISIRAGLPRDSRIESELDMVEVKRFLAAYGRERLVDDG